MELLSAHQEQLKSFQAAPPPPSTAPTKPKKLRRSTRACDFCHRRSIRCKSSETPGRCQNCCDFDVACTYDRPAKKRGVKAANPVAGPGTGAFKDERDEGTQHANLLLHLTQENVHRHHQGLPYITPARNAGPSGTQVEADGLVGFALDKEHREMVLNNRDKVANLVAVYFEVVYPIFPLFHRRTLLRKIAARDYLKDRALFATVMSICALCSARIRDGALPPGRWDQTYFSQPSAEFFLLAARDVLPSELADLRGMDYMRCCAMLALYGIQVGRTEIMHQYLGLYHSLIAMDGMHDEKNWPDTGIVELELRRRLFWSMYTLEVYCSIVWGCVIRCRESQSRVAYPSEVDDEFFSDQGFEKDGKSAQLLSQNPSMPTEPVTDPLCWLHGWNFTTDMYRILEHAMNDFHRRRPQTIGSFSPADLFLKETTSQSAVLEKVMSMYDSLHPRFKEPRSMVSEMSEDIFSFQAANLTATLQMVRMVLFTAETATIEQKCGIARELLEGFSRVPTSFLKAISSPLLYQLAGVGGILGSVIEGPLLESSYLQVRDTLLAMADLMANLESGMTRTITAAARLRNLIHRIDEYMLAQRQPEYQTTAMPSQHEIRSQTEQSQHSHAHLQHSPSYATPMSEGSMMNVDPALQGLQQQQHTWDASRATANGYYDHIGPNGASLTGSIADNEASIVSTADQAYEEYKKGSTEMEVQIPAELLADWPWPIEGNMGFPPQPGFPTFG